jgi:hypothetical protein
MRLEAHLDVSSLLGIRLSKSAHPREAVSSWEGRHSPLWAGLRFRFGGDYSAIPPGICFGAGYVASQEILSCPIPVAICFSRDFRSPVSTIPFETKFPPWTLGTVLEGADRE